MKILILSDSHLINDWTKLKSKYDIVIHAGDHQMSKEWILYNTDYHVDGNNDWGDKNKNIFEIEGIKFCLIHGDEHHIKNKNNWSDSLLELAKKENVNVLIYGHTHIPSIKEVDNIIFINPGSISKPRFPSNNITYCEMNISDKKIINISIKTFDL